MDRRDRDNRKPAPRGPQADARRPGPPNAPALASYEDPNAYRSPGFQDVMHQPYRIDYEGLPKDDDEDNVGNLAPGLPSAPLTNHGARNPRGMGGRRRDYAGTDPSAYRSPAFREELAKSRRPGFAQGAGNARPGPRGNPPAQGAAPAGERGPSRRERRNERPKFETTCNACGAAAVVPFEPGPDRPAFCKACYEVKKAELGLGPGKRPPPAAETP
jgi:CxxC-x17-CxxC domain-containing protein